MGDFLNQKLKEILKNKRQRRNWAYSIIGLSLAVMLITNSLLAVQSVAMTYDDHMHTEDCYEEQTTLVCGQEESEGHQHSDDCYTLVRGALVCQDTSEEHVHTDDCYEWNRELTCAMEEGEGAHHHTEDCYHTERVLVCGKVETRTAKEPDVKEEDLAAEETTEAAEVEGTEAVEGVEGTEDVEGTEASADAPAEEPLTEEQLAQMPAQHFEATTDDGTGNGEIKVVVEAEAGTFPADTRMEVELVEDEEEVEETEKAVTDAITDEIKENSEVKVMQIVDIRFISPEGEEIEPLRPVLVTMTSDAIKESEDVVIVHVDDKEEGKNEVIKQKEEGELKELDIEPSENAVVFDAEKFSKYVIVGTGTIITEWTLQTPDGEDVTYVVSVTFGKNAEIPEGAELRITEYDENSSEYLKAKEAVVEKKMGEIIGFDPESIGLTAFDISLYDADGNKIEPQDTVEVSFRMKRLPEEVVENGLQYSLELQHLDESSDELNVVTVASAVQGNLVADDISAEAEFQLSSFSTFTINWGNNREHTTIHYGYMEGGVFHEFEQQPSPTDTTTNEGWAYLIYDFDGTDSEGRRFEYEYSHTYYQQREVSDPTSGTSVVPAVRYSQGAWRYYAENHGYDRDQLNTDRFWEPVANQSHLYVVYDKPTIPEGGAPKLSDDTPEPDIPTILKQSDDNGDGTHTLSLSITGSEQDIEVETLADVIVVLDLSSSMQNNIRNNSSTGNGYATNQNSRYYQAKQAVITLANNLYQKNVDSGKSLIRMGLVTFAGNATVEQELTDDRSVFLSTVNGISRYTGKGTNWEHSLKLANEMDVDPNRATFVIFVTDGEPTTSQTRGGMGNGANGGLRSTLFQAGNQGGGIPNNYGPHSVHNDIYGPLHFYLRSGTFGSTDANNSYNRTNYTAAHDDAKSIVDHGKNFYVIAISSDVGTDALNELLSEAGVGNDHGIPATNQQELVDAFAKIESEISGVLGWGDIQMTDGITELTNTVSKSPLVDFGDEFTYYISNAPANWDNWSADEKEAYQKGVEYAGKEDPEGYDDGWTDAQRAAYQDGKNISFRLWTDEERAAAKCLDAAYDPSSGSVKWDMGPQFMLQDGVSYKVSFTCWPSQEAYDILAKCRNDESFYNSLTPEQQSQIKRTGSPGNYNYTLKTNKDGANTTYKTATRSGDTITTSGEPRTILFGEVPDLLLSEQKIFIKKEWENIIDGRKEESINLGVYAGDDETDLFATITVGNNEDPEKDWRGSAFISTGLLIYEESLSKVVLYETGHDFSITENVEGGPAYRWELESATYRPMVITDSRKGYDEPTTVILKKVTSSDAYDYEIEERDGTHSYYQIVSGASADLVATNYRRSNLNLTKNVVDKDGTTIINDLYPDELFTFTIKITDPTISEPSDQDIWFSVQDEDGNTVAVETSASYKETRRVDGAVYDPDTNTYTYEYEGETYTLPAADDGTGGLMYTGYYAVPNDQSFTVEMKPSWNLRVTNLPRGTTYSFVESGKDGFECLGTTLAEKYGDQEPVVSELDSGATREGSITNTNTEYTVTYFNKSNLLDITIIKTDDSATPKNLGGATFRLLMKNSGGVYEQIGEVFEVPEDGYSIAGLRAGDYMLEEVSPPPSYIITKKSIYFTLSDGEDGVIILADDSQETASVDGDNNDELYVQNTAGVELPSAGGPGTFLYTLSGLALVLGSALMYGFRMRRRERRLK